MRPLRLAVLLLWIAGTGCVRRDGRNSDCRWPAETSTHQPTGRHLSADAEFAEDLAIRFADTHHGLRTPYFVSGEAYNAARNRCLQSLLAEIGKEHGVTSAQVYATLGRNRWPIDLAVNLPFALFYGLAAAAIARRVWRRYPPAEDRWMPGLVVTLFLSLVFAAGCSMVGEVWSWLVETVRIGNGHMSYRVARLPWARYRLELTGGAWLVFWVTAGFAARRARGQQPMTAKS